MHNSDNSNQVSTCKFLQTHLNKAVVWLLFLLIVAIKFEMFDKVLNGVSFIVLLFTTWLVLSYIIAKTWGLE